MVDKDSTDEENEKVFRGMALIAAAYHAGKPTMVTGPDSVIRLADQFLTYIHTGKLGNGNPGPFK